jgi:hypothetical protein
MWRNKKDISTYKLNFKFIFSKVIEDIITFVRKNMLRTPQRYYIFSFVPLKSLSLSGPYSIIKLIIKTLYYIYIYIYIYIGLSYDYLLTNKI